MLFESVESHDLEPITREQTFKTFEQSRLTFLYQDAIARHFSRWFELIQRGGSGADLLGTNAPYRCFPV